MRVRSASLEGASPQYVRYTSSATVISASASASGPVSIVRPAAAAAAASAFRTRAHSGANSSCSTVRFGRGLDRRERGVAVLGAERGVEPGAPVGIDEQRGERVRRLVPSGARNRPHRIERFVRGQDLLDVHRMARHLRRDALEVRSRICESVDVVDAQPVHDTVVHELERERVGGREHPRVLDAHADQVRHVEEAPVVDEPAAAPPLRELVRLALERGREGFGLGEVDAVDVAQGQRFVERMQLAGVGVQRPGGELRRGLAPEERPQHLARCDELVAGPVDVEPRRGHRVATVAQQRVPPGVPSRDGLVVRHDVEQHAEPGRVGGTGERFEPGAAAELGVDFGRIDHVIPVPAPGPGAEHRRQIAPVDAEISEVRHHRARGGKVEVGVELQAIGRDRRERSGAPTGRALGERERE